MTPDDRIRLHHMLDAAREALEFVSGRTRQELDTDRMLVLSLVKEIEIIGEAASRLSQESQSSIPGIPWQDVIGMRNRLIHVYYDVNLDIVWSAVTKELPSLVADLEKVIDT